MEANAPTRAWGLTIRKQDWKLYGTIAAAIALTGLGVGALYFSAQTKNNKKTLKKKKVTKKDLEKDDDPLLEEIKKEDIDILRPWLDIKDHEFALMTPIVEMEEHGSKLKEIGNNLFRKGEYSNAITTYTLALKFTPNSAILYCNKAACLANLRQHEKAIEDCSKAIEKDPSYLKAFLRRAQAHENIENKREALDDYTAALLLSSNKNEPSRLGIERLLELISSDEADTILNKRGPMLASKVYIESFVGNFSFDELKEFENEKQADKEYRLANNAMALKNYEEAFKHVQTAIDLGTKFQAESLNLIGIYKFALFKYDEAETLFKQCCQLKPFWPMPRILIASCQLEQGNSELAMKTIRDALRVFPGNKDVHYNIGQINFMLGNYEEALEEYQKSVEIAADFYLGYVQLGVVNFKMGNIHLCNSIYEKLIKQFPNNADVYNYYAEILQAQGRFDDAYTHLMKALQIDPKFSSPYCNLALYYLNAKYDFKSAEEQCFEALKHEPKLDVAYALLGQIYAMQQDFEKSVTVYTKLIELGRNRYDVLGALSHLEAANSHVRVFQNHPHLKNLYSVQ